jgi:hypothetical protein
MVCFPHRKGIFYDRPAQVHAALTYYYDHQHAIDAALVASYIEAEQQRQQHLPHPKLVAIRARQTD